MTTNRHDDKTRARELLDMLSAPGLTDADRRQEIEGELDLCTRRLSAAGSLVGTPSPGRRCGECARRIEGTAWTHDGMAFHASCLVEGMR